MGMKINGDMGINAPRQLQNASAAVNKNLRQLASGLRINRAADDAAGLAVAETLRTQILQANQETNNLQAGTSVVQTADAALGTQQEAISRMRELAVQANNGTLSTDQRNALNQEMQQLVQQVEQTGQQTQFNGQTLLNGTTGAINLGTQGGATINIGASTADSLGLNGISIATPEEATNALTALETAAQNINTNRASLGAQENGIASAINTTMTASENAQAAESQIRDLNVAQAAIEQIRSQASLQQGVFAAAQGNMVAQNAARLLQG